MIKRAKNKKYKPREERIFFGDEERLPELFNLKKASEILQCHPNTLRQWDKKGILVAVRFGERKDRRYRKEDILKLLNQKRK
ncbi:MAG: MerR family transcriptional regulator [Thermodesulfovibrionia bacterium]|nr:MerR family transcriptional regulator [Thermodesulfovibrionia bacterium]